MELVEIFQVLGIEQTKDEQLIKNAYRKKLTVTNPEDNPEGFKRLRAAYDEACVYARRTEEEPTVADAIEDTAAGRWVQRAAEIYGHIDTRRDVKLWKELFDEDIFLSLEEEENCRFQLLRFLMEHFKLPTAVWKLLDEKLHIVEEAPKLRERFPADFVGYLVAKCERGEDVEFEQFEGAPDGNYDLFLQYYDRCWQAINDNQLEQAAEYLQNADDLHIFHPVMEVCRANLLLKQDKPEEAMRLMRKLQERFPEDVMVCYNAGEMFWKNGSKEAAASIYESLKSANSKHYMANVRLTEWYYECGRYQEAKKCAEEVLSAGADDNFMEILAKVNHELEKEMEANYREQKEWRTGMDLCWCYLQDGKVNKGIRLAKELEGEVPTEKRAEYNGLLAKLYVEGAEYESAIAMAEIWEQSLIEKLKNDDEAETEKDKDRIRQSHIIRMQCHRSLGYVDNKHFVEAIREADTIMTGTSKDIGLMLEKAQIYMEMEEYEQSIDLTNRLIEDYQVYAAYATAMEVYRRQWDAPGVVRCGQQCIRLFPTYVKAYEHAAKVFLDLKQVDDLKALLADADKNHIKSVILDAYRYQMEHEVPSAEILDEKIDAFRKEYLSKVEKGKLDYYEKGLPILTEYLYWYPGTYMLVERGIFHKAANRLEEAEEDFEKALAENPAQPYALNGLSFVYKFKGDYERAIIYSKRSILYMGDELSPVRYADLGNLYSLLGDYEKALEAYKRYLELATEKKQRSAYYMRNMAFCMARCGQIDEAISMYEAACGDTPQYYDDAVNVYQITGNGKQAEMLLEKWKKKLLNSTRQAPFDNYDDYYSKMAWQELLYGTDKKALEYFEKLLKVKAHDNSIAGSMCDMIFACILCGDDARGQLYAAKLREWQQKEKAEGRNDYYNSDKSRLELDFLAEYYREDAKALEEILALEEKCQICHFCTYHICKEMEAMRILLLLRKGEREAAFARLERNLEQQPLDEYMLAIRHMCEGGVRVVPYSVNAPKSVENNAAKVSAEVQNVAKQPEKEHRSLLRKLTDLFGKK
ncbi:MAG: tetratricopeptide repeat protein [Lachnospiraceae bacterium]|nr:tetratricopeptide repeat protein [Lachnospiraceae bacterium]